MRVLITGIDGFVGSHLAAYLLTRPGVEIHGTILGPEPHSNIAGISSRLRLRQADILNPGRVEELFHDIRPDRIIHLAAQPLSPLSVQDPHGTFQTNICGGVTILDAARKLREREGSEIAVLLISSAEVYGRVDPRHQPITEETLLRPANPYAASKAGLDLIGQGYAKTYGMRVVIARPFNLAGPRQNSAFVCSEFGRRFAEFALKKRPPVLHVGNISSRRDLTDVRDVVVAYWSLLEQKAPEGVFNVCSGKVHEIRDIIALYEELSGISVGVAIEEGKVRRHDIPLLLGSNERLRAATGWAPTIPLRTTLRDVLRFWRDEIAAGS